MKKYKISEYARLNKVTVRTVWNWIKLGKVKIETSLTGRHLIIEEDYEANQRELVAVYARVSSSENKDNLEKQTDRLISYANAKGYKIEKVIKEIGSGLNDERKGLISLLKDKSINLIIVEHKDRLTRFGFNYIETLLENENRKIEVINPSENHKEDLVADFVSIITSFCARIYGQRRTKRKTEKLIELLNEENRKVDCEILKENSLK